MSEGEFQSLMDQLEPILSVLRSTDGYFVFRDREGEEYVLVRALDLKNMSESSDEKQLPLPKAEPRQVSGMHGSGHTLDEVLERINREIALFQAQREESMSVQEEENEREDSREQPSLRVRFEPLRGDLPPELQE